MEALTVSAISVAAGDPWPTYTGDNLKFGPNHGTYIGDFPDVLPDYPHPNIPGIYPIPQKVIPLGPSPWDVQPFVPQIVPNSIDLSKSFTLGRSVWHIEHLQDKSVFQCDVPGSKEADVKVEISDREITVIAFRPGRGSSIESTALDVKFYDVHAAKAHVEDGLCTIEVPYKSQQPVSKIQVPITKK